MSKKIFIILLFSFSLVSKAQELILERPISSNTLPTSIVYSINQSLDGYTFLGTDKGLIKFNGLYYEQIHLNTKGKAVHNLISQNNKIYGLTFSKELFIWSKDSIQIFSIKNNIELSKLSWFKIIGNSIIVFGPKSLQIIDKNTMKVVFTKKGDDFPTTWDAYDENNQVKVLFNDFQINSLNEYKGFSNTLVDESKIIKPLMFIFKGKNYCFDGYNKVFYLINDQKKIKLNWNTSILEKQKIHSVTSFNNELIAIATYNGLFLLNEEGELQYHLLKETPVSSVFENDKGQLWIATLNDGIHIISSLQSNLYNLKKTIGEKDKVNHCLFDKNEIILGTHQGKLIKLNLENDATLINKFDKSAEIQTIAKVSDKYYAYCEKLYEFNSNLTITDSINITATKSITNIRDTLYIGTSQGIYIYTNKKIIEEKYKHNWFESLYYNQNKNLLAANTSLGTYFLNTKTNRWIFDSLKTNYKTSQNNTLEGCIYEQHLNVNSDNKVKITEEFNNYYLLNNNQYLVEYTDHLILNNLTLNTKIKLVKNVDYFNQNIIGCSILNDKIIIVFDDKIQTIGIKNRKKFLKPKILIENSNININQDDFRLPYNESLVFQIDVLSNIYDKGSTELFYKLSNTSSEWIRIQPNKKKYELRLERLPYGSNSIQLKAISHSYLKADTLSINFIVDRPFWLTWWFITLLAIVLIFIVLILIKFRLNQIKKKSKKELYLKRLEIQSLNSKLEALQSQMNPHFIFNSLNSIQTLVLKGDVESSYKYINKFSDLMRQTLSFSETQLVPFHEEVDLLNNYLLLEKLRFRDDFNYEIKTNGISNINVPPMLLQPLIENALKHGLLHKKSNRKLSIEFKLNKGLICTIIDNGIGRKAASEIKKRQNNPHKSYAVESLFERFEYLRQKMSFDNIGFTYYDLYENDNPKGTKVVVRIPFIKNN